MSDGGKSGIGGLVSDVAEAAVKPVVDEVGRAIESGAQGVSGGAIGKPQDPDAQKKAEERKIEEQKKREYWNRVLEWNKNVQDAQKKVRIQEEQKKQAQQQVKQQEEQVKQFKIEEKKQKSVELTAAQREARKSEMKGGVGG